MMLQKVGHSFLPGQCPTAANPGSMPRSRGRNMHLTAYIKAASAICTPPMCALGGSSSSSSLHASPAPFHVSRLPSKPSAPAGRGSHLTAHFMSSTSTNPAFTYGKVSESISTTGRGSSGLMTMDGAAQKATILLAVSMVGAAATWAQVFSGNPAAAYSALGASKVAGFVGLLSALATMFKPHWSPITALVFAGSKGIALGGMTALVETMYPGIALNACMLTFGTAASLLLGFQSGLIRVTDQFRAGVGMVTGGYCVMLMGSFLLSMVGVRLPSLLSAGPVGIGISLLASGLAASNLLLDFDMIQSAAYRRMPKWFEWYSGFSLMVTLVWFYTEVLRLLLMFARGSNSRD